MAISIGDALLKIGVDTKDFDKKMTGIRGTIEKHRKAIGIAMVASGAAIVGSLALSLKAAAAEEAGIERLSIAMKNVGLSYEEAQGSLEGWINAQQQATAFADSDMRDALASMIRMTGDLAEAQDYLTLAMDVAVGTNKDLASASQLVQYAMGGNWGMVERYIPALKAVENEEEKWAELRRLFAGQAEAYGQTLAGQMDLLKNNVGDVVEALGAALLPVATSLLETIMPIIESMKEWIAEHPTLTKVIVIASGVLGVLLTALGGLLLLMPSITAAMAAFGITLHLSLGPIGLVILGVTALIAAGIALWKNWDKVVHFFEIAWIEIKQFFLRGVESILGALAKFTSWIPTLGEEVAKAHKAISDMIDADEVRKDAIRTERALILTEKAMDDTTEAAVALEDSIAAIGETSKETAEVLEEQAIAVDVLKKSYDGLAGAVRPTGEPATEEAQRAAQIAAAGEPGRAAIARGGNLSDIIESVMNWRGVGIPAGYGPPSGAKTWAELRAKGASEERISAFQNLLERVGIGISQFAPFAEGGIAMRPMLAQVAERKPEAILPLDKLSGMVGLGGRVVNIILELDGRILAKAIEVPLVNDIRLRTGLKI